MEQEEWRAYRNPWWNYGHQECKNGYC